jgi:hypothetical protein
VRRALLPLALLVAAAHAAPAGATTLVSPDGSPAPPRYQAWLAAAQVPTPPGAVTLQLAPCPAGPEWAGGCADLQARTIYLGPDARTPARFFHELGHVFDATAMTDPLRARFQVLVVRRGGPWNAAAPSDPPQEKFAEAYSMCARHRTARAIQFGMYGYSPSPQMHRRACAIIRAAR